MNKYGKMNELGLMGEKIVINYLSSQGRKVEHSVDKFDSKKDLISDEKIIEVKTQVPFIKEKALTFRPNQLKKCRSVDELYFVTVPAKHTYEWSGWLFQVDPKNFIHRERKTKDGRQMILVDIEQEAVKPLIKIKEEHIKHLVRYASSDY